MAFPKKDERNKDLLKKCHHGWTYEELGDYFGINAKTAWDLHKVHCKELNCPKKEVPVKTRV